jgi:hypothetical protein
LYCGWIGFSFDGIGGKEHGTSAERRWRLVLKTLQREYEGFIIESPDPKSGFV